MGANSAGVVGGNEAVFTLLSDELLHSDGTPNKSLLGMDLLRLALEMGTTAKHAVEICIHFLEKYGQGGPCSEGDDKWSYENSFIFADANEAYVLETAGKRHWAYERVGPGEYRNISNGISIRCNWEAVSNDIKSMCKDKGWWSGKSEFGTFMVHPSALCLVDTIPHQGNQLYLTANDSNIPESTKTGSDQ